MLTWLGLCTIAVLLLLILLRLSSVFVALTVVPIASALIGGFGLEIGTFALDGIRSVTPIAALLAFAVVYFGVMNDAGLFDPFVRWLGARVGRDPVRIALGTAAIAVVSHLDGAGASTFMVTVPAMLPLFKAAGMRPLTLTCITALGAGTMNMLPWAGPASRAAAALSVDLNDLFLPLVPAMLAGLFGVFALAVHLGRSERRLIETSSFIDPEDAGTTTVASADEPAAARAGSRVLWCVNAVLTVATLTMLFVNVAPLPLVFLMAAALALLVNYPDAQHQRERLTAHGASAMMMVTTIFAAGVFTGVLSGSGMMGALSSDLVRILPDAALQHLPIVVAITSMPLSLVFDPDSFYFGLLPVLAEASRGAGGSAIEVGRAALLGQMTTGFPVSPLTPSTFLLVGLAEVDLADHQRRTIGYAFALTLVMTVVALATRALRW